MTARNPMGGWETCPVHGTSFQDPDGCPDCARPETPPQTWRSAARRLWRLIRGRAA